MIHLEPRTALCAVVLTLPFILNAVACVRLSLAGVRG